MKKVLLTVLILVLTFSLVGCGSSYGKIKSAFEKEGYAEQTIEAGDEYKQMEEEFKAEGIEFTFHHLQKEGLLGDRDVLILEFKNVDGIKEILLGDNEIADMMAYLLDELDTSYEDIYQSLVDVGLVNGNCMFVPSDIIYLVETMTIFKNA